MAQVTDFTGTYDYEREEARHVASGYREDMQEGYYRSVDEYHQALIKERAHWAKCLNDAGMKDFADEFNSLTIGVCRVVFGKEIYL